MSGTSISRIPVERELRAPCRLISEGKSEKSIIFALLKRVECRACLRTARRHAFVYIIQFMFLEIGTFVRYQLNFLVCYIRASCALNFHVNSNMDSRIRAHGSSILIFEILLYEIESIYYILLILINRICYFVEIFEKCSSDWFIS